MQNELFRKSALQSLSSPEQLDQLLKITSPKAWIALCAIGAILLAAVAWSIFGKLPTTVTGHGVVIRKGGISNIVSNGSGTLFDLKDFRPGDEIQKGQIVGHVSQPLLEQQIAEAKINLGQERFISAKEDEMQQKILRAKEEQLSSLRNTEQQQAELWRAGLITRQRYDETRQAIYATQNDIAAAKIALHHNRSYEEDAGAGNQPRVREESSRVQQAVNRLNELQLRYQVSSNITSEYKGTVIEILAENGEAVKEGQPIISIEAEHKRREVVTYLPSSGIAKSIKPGMEAHISPVTHKKEQYGYLIGKVLTVSKFPATEEGMMVLLNNTALVRELSKNGPPTAVAIEFVVDEKTRSGYKWSSKAGDAIEVRSGTLCSATFIIEEKRPISLIIPLLKEVIGVGS